MYNAKIKDIEDKIGDITTSTALNAKINEVKNKIPNITNLATTTALTAVENKIHKMLAIYSIELTMRQKLKIINQIMNMINILLLSRTFYWKIITSKSDIADFVKKTSK